LKIDGTIKVFHDKQKLKQCMTTKPNYKRFSKEFCTQKMKTNKTMRGQAPNHRGRKDKELENKIDSAAYNQTLKQQKQLTTGITACLSILTLNVNGLNSPIKRHCLAYLIKKEVPAICCLQETHLIDRNKHWLTLKGWKNIYQAMAPQNRQA
jgi:hypothetical protein